METNKKGKNFSDRFKKAMKKLPKVKRALMRPNIIMMKGETPKKLFISHIWSVVRMNPKVASTSESANIKDSMEAARPL